MSREEAIRRITAYFDGGGFFTELALRIAVPTESQNPERRPALYQYLREVLVPEFKDLGFTCKIHENPVARGGPFLVAKAVLPAMRERGKGSFLISNNASSLRGRKRRTGQSLYYPRVMMRTLAQVLTEEYSEFGVHVANVIIDGLIDSPGTRLLPIAQKRPEIVINPVKIAEAFWYLQSQDPSCWTHELQDGS